MLFTNFNQIKDKNIIDNCNKNNDNITNKTGDKNFKTEKKFEKENLKFIEQLKKIFYKYVINISRFKKLNYNIYIFKI